MSTSSKSTIPRMFRIRIPTVTGSLSKVQFASPTNSLTKKNEYRSFRIKVAKWKDQCTHSYSLVLLDKLLTGSWEFVLVIIFWKLEMGHIFVRWTISNPRSACSAAQG